MNTFDPRYFMKYFTKQLALACGLVAISTFNYAFDQQGFNSTQAMPYFSKAFGYYDPATKKYALHTYYLSLLNSLVYVGFAFGKGWEQAEALICADRVLGAYIGSVISARYGRRMTIFCMSLWALVTATILVTSGVTLNRWQVCVLVHHQALKEKELTSTLASCWSSAELHLHWHGAIYGPSLSVRSGSGSDSRSDGRLLPVQSGYRWSDH